MERRIAGDQASASMGFFVCALASREPAARFGNEMALEMPARHPKSCTDQF